MDAWNEAQLRKMEAGGNSKMNNFFRRYGVQKTTPSTRKYNSKAAEVPLAVSTARFVVVSVL